MSSASNGSDGSDESTELNASNESNASGDSKVPAGAGAASGGRAGGRRGLARYALFAAATVLATFVAMGLLLEVGLRIADWPSPGLYQGGKGPLALALPNEDGSCWRDYPGPARLRHWDYDVDVHINEHGFLEADRVAKRDGEWRVGLFGDSFTAGMGVTADERFGTRWWRALQQDRPEVTVANFGSAWSGTAHSAAFLARHGTTWELDEVVLALFGGNELGDNERWETSRDLSEAQRAEVARRLWSGGWRDRIRNSSRAAGFLYLSVARGLARRTPFVPGRSRLAEAWPATEAALDAFVAAAGSRPISVWYLPGTVEWHAPAWAATQESLGLADDERHVVRDAVEAWARARGVAFLDVTPALVGPHSEALRFPNDGHWNAAGHARVARLLVDRALVRGPVRPAALSSQR